MSWLNAIDRVLYQIFKMTKQEVENSHAIRIERVAPSSEPVYLVLESDPLVAEDITGSLQAIGPCRVIRVPTAEDIPTNLRDVHDVSAAFLDVRYAKVREAGLDEMLMSHGARIVLTVGEDDRAEALANGWGMLVRPFTDKMIQSFVDT
jgi:hypothetical protein